MLVAQRLMLNILVTYRTNGLQATETVTCCHVEMSVNWTTVTIQSLRVHSQMKHNEALISNTRAVITPASFFFNTVHTIKQQICA